MSLATIPDIILFSKPPYPKNSIRSASSYKSALNDDLFHKEVRRLRGELLEQAEIHQKELEEQRHSLKQHFSRILEEQTESLHRRYELLEQEVSETSKQAQFESRKYKRKAERASFRCQEMEEENAMLHVEIGKVKSTMEGMATKFSGKIARMESRLAEKDRIMRSMKEASKRDKSHLGIPQPRFKTSFPVNIYGNNLSLKDCSWEPSGQNQIKKEKTLDASRCKVLSIEGPKLPEESTANVNDCYFDNLEAGNISSFLLPSISLVFSILFLFIHTIFFKRVQMVNSLDGLQDYWPWDLEWNLYIEF